MGSQRVRHNRSDLACTHISLLLPHDNFIINLGAERNTHYYLIVTVVRNPGIAYLDPLTQRLVKLPSWCQLGLQSYLSPAQGRNCFQAHMAVGGIWLLAGCQRMGFSFLLIIISWGHPQPLATCLLASQKSVRERASPSKMDDAVSYNIIMYM